MSEYGTAVLRLNPRHEGRASHLVRDRVRVWVRVRVRIRVKVKVKVKVKVRVRVRVREACVAPAARLVQSEQRGGTPSHAPSDAPSVLR